MKIYFNSTFIETKRETDDLFVKGNNGNKLEAYFEDLDLSNVNINLRLVIGWSNNETTNELPMNKSFDNQYAYINLPKLKHDGNTQFIIKIYQNGTLLQTAIFTRNIKETLEANDNTNIGSDEYQGLLNQIKDIDDKSNMNATRIKQLQESLNGTDDDIVALDTRVETLEEKTELNTTRINQLQQSLNGTDDDIIGIDIKIDELNDKTSLNKTRIDQLQQSLNTTDDDVVALDIRIDKLEKTHITNAEKEIQDLRANKQDKLISGVNIKTINGKSILGGGDIVITGGGGGGTSNNIFVESISPLSQVIAVNSKLSVTFNVNFSVGSSGIVYIYGNDVLKEAVNINEGRITLDVTKAITSTENAIKLMFVDSVGTSTSITYLVNVLELRITSNFDDSRVYEGNVDFRYIPYGEIEKIIHFEIDGKEIEPDIVYTSGETTPKQISNLSVGVHKLKVYATATIDNKQIKSNELNYNLMITETGNNTILISSKFNVDKITQGELLSIDYIVYNPLSQTTNVKLKINDEMVNNVNVGRTKQYWNLNDYPLGLNKFTIEVDENNKLDFSVLVEKSQINVKPVETNLELYLNAKNRSNSESAENITKWSYKGINGTLKNFNFSTNGWLSDNKGNSILRINGDAQVEIPFNIFVGDFLNEGKTIEFDFSTTDIYDINKVLVSCYDGIKGFKITSNDCLLKSELTSVETKFKEDERVRVSFVIEPSASNRLVKTFINGVLSGLAQYPTNDDFTQNNPAIITINPEKDGSIDIYSIRIYNSDLNNKQILYNYMSDLSVSEQMNSFIKNDILDDYGKVSYAKIKSLIPILTITGDLPATKGDEKQVNVSYIDPFNANSNFEYENVTIDIQGTSSQFYPRKNYKIKFNEKFSFYEGAIPEKTYTFKADYMESSHSHNTGNAKLMNLLSPKFPTQTNNNGVRNSIYGFPIVIFVKKDSNAVAEYYGVFNFNNDKGNTDTIGLTTSTAESWEFKNNTSARCLFRSNDFVNKVEEDFEARYPKDYTDYTALSRVVSWVYSTRNNITKFKNEFEQYFNKDFCLFYYIMMDVLLAVDSRAKNMFLDTLDGQIWYPRWYDIDTSYGLNNEGVNQFSYGLEQHDYIENVAVYNGEDSLLWNNFELAFENEIKEAYKKYRSTKDLNYETIYNILYGEQVSKISENMYNTDGQFKYVGPLVENNDSTYLYVEQGSRINHLQWWLSNRFKYLDSKYEYSDFKDDFISMRTYTPDSYVVAPTNYFDLKYFTDGYAQVLFGSSNVRERTTANEVVRVTAPEGLTFNNTETIIYGASKILDIGDVSTKYARTMDFSKATKLKRLQIGNNTSGYLNTNLESLTIGNNTMLEYLNIENCSKLTQAIDLTGCLNVKEVYAKGSSVTAINFAKGGNLKTLELPSTVTNLSLINQPFLNKFVMDDYSNVSTLRIENTPIINSKQILNSVRNVERVRITNVDWQLYNSEQSILNKLLKVRGISETGGNIDKAVLTGKVHIEGTVGTGSIIKWLEYFGNDLIISADEVKQSYTVKFVNWDGTLLYETDVIEGQEAVYVGETPTKPNDEEGYEYTFSGWDKSLSNVTSDMIVTPVFASNKPTIITLNLTDASYLQPTISIKEIFGTCSVDWGDGTTQEATMSLWSTNLTKSSPYPSVGIYEIKVLVNKTGYGSSQHTINVDGNYIKYIINFSFQEGIFNATPTGMFKKSQITTIKFPEGFEKLGTDTFNDCSQLTEIKLPSTLKNIESGCFDGIKNLQNIYTNEKSWINDNDIIISEGLERIIDFPTESFDFYQGKNAIFPSTLKTIGDPLFMEKYAGGKYVTVEKIIFKSVNPPTKSSSRSFVINGSTGSDNWKVPIEVPAQSLELYKTATNWTSFTNITGYTEEE